jgi:hypothetical protein
MVLDLRSYKEEGLWIDQLCIDQGSPSEKMRAIHNMDAVFRSARLITIVLEDADLTLDEEQILEILSEKSAGTSELRFLSSESVMRNFSLLPIVLLEQVEGLAEKIFKCRWLSRAWCYHEFLLSRENIILLPGITGPGFALSQQSPNEIVNEMGDKCGKNPLWPSLTTFDHHDGKGRNSLKSEVALSSSVAPRHKQ